MTDFTINRKNAEQVVMQILRDKPETRGDDMKLILEVWTAQGLKLTQEQEHLFHQLMSTETIRRSRQKVQERGLYRAGSGVEKQRSLLESEHRTYYRGE